MSADLDAIRQRAEAATCGPWKLVTDTCDCNDGYGCRHGTFPYALRLPGHTVRYVDQPCEPGDPADSHRHNASEISDLTMETAEFLAAARADVLALLAEVARLRAELDTMTYVARGNKRHYAEAAVMLDRFNDLIHDTDGDPLDDREDVPVGEIRRALCEPVRSDGCDGLTEAQVDHLTRKAKAGGAA